MYMQIAIKTDVHANSLLPRYTLCVLTLCVTHRRALCTHMRETLLQRYTVSIKRYTLSCIQRVYLPTLAYIYSLST